MLFVRVLFPQVVFEFETSVSVTMTEPYIAGFLAFREVDFLLERLSVVRSERPRYTYGCSMILASISFFFLRCY